MISLISPVAPRKAISNIVVPEKKRRGRPPLKKREEKAEFKAVAASKMLPDVKPPPQPQIADMIKAIQSTNEPSAARVSEVYDEARQVKKRARIPNPFSKLIR